MNDSRLPLKTAVDKGRHVVMCVLVGCHKTHVFVWLWCRMSYRRQKRWWNAYILFYEQVNETSETDEDKPIIKTMQELTIGDWFGLCFVALFNYYLTSAP